MDIKHIRDVEFNGKVEHEYLVDGCIIYDSSKSIDDFRKELEEDMEKDRRRHEDIMRSDWNTPTPICEIYNCDDKEADIICTIGNWGISNKGDLYFDEHWISEKKFLNPYAIYSDRLKEDDWILHLTEKA